MQPPHPELPWPALDPDELTRVSGELNRLALDVRSGIESWMPHPTDWEGRGADAHRSALARTRIRAAQIPEATEGAASAIGQLLQMVGVARRQIVLLARSVETAEWSAAMRRNAAEDAAQAAARASVTELVSNLEVQRLRDEAARAWHRAEDARREVDLVLRHAIDVATDLVETIRRRDLFVAQILDELLTTPMHMWTTPREPETLVAIDDRGWIPLRINDTTTAIQHHVDALAAAIAQIEAVPWFKRAWWETSALIHLRAAHETHRRFLSPGRQMLEWSLVGGGRAVEVFGDLTTARHIAVVVPGIMNTIDNFDDDVARSSRDLWTEASALERETAVVAWLGYDTPELVNAVSKGRAVEYEAELRSFVASLPSDAHVTVVAHSYGTVVAAESASRGLSADDLVLVGSPGTRLDHASEADLEHGAQVFAGVSDTDWVVGRAGWGSVVCPETILGAGWSMGLRRLASPVTGPLSWVTDSCNTDGDGDVKGLSHGINPAHEDFGAIEISTEGVDGHSSYFDPESSSLDAIARVVAGVHPNQH